MADEPLLAAAGDIALRPSEIVGPKRVFCLISKLRPGFALCVDSEISPEVSPCHCPGQNPEWVLAMVKAGSSHSGAICLPTTKGPNSPPGTMSHSPPACIDLPLRVSVVPSYSTLAWALLYYRGDTICLKSLDALA